MAFIPGNKAASSPFGTTRDELLADLASQRNAPNTRRANWGTTERLDSFGTGVRKWSMLALVESQQSRNWTIGFSSSQSSSPELVVLARIRWGNGGVQFETTLSAINGFTLNLTGAFISVEAALDGIVGTSVNVGAYISESDASRSEPYFQTLVPNDGIGLAPDTGLTVDLPAFAKNVKVIPRAPVGGTAFSVADTPSNALPAAWQENFGPNEKMSFEPLTGKSILITNNDGINMFYAVIAELSL